MTNSYFRRPRTEQVRGPGQVQRANRISGADRVRVTRGRDGSFRDWSNPKIAGQNAALQFKEIENFLGQVTETAIPAAKDLMQDWGVTEAQGLLRDPGFMDICRAPARNMPMPLWRKASSLVIRRDLRRRCCKTMR